MSHCVNGDNRETSPCQDGSDGAGSAILAVAEAMSENNNRVASGRFCGRGQHRMKVDLVRAEAGSGIAARRHRVDSLLRVEISGRLICCEKDAAYAADETYGQREVLES